MPRSKRAKVIPHSKVAKKSQRDARQLRFSGVRAAAAGHPYVYVFEAQNLRSSLSRNARDRLPPPSEIFFGKTKLTARALCTAAGEPASVDDEKTDDDDGVDHGKTTNAYRPGMQALRPLLTGEIGIICSECPPSRILEWASKVDDRVFARAGTIAPVRVVLATGTLRMAGNSPLDSFASSDDPAADVDMDADDEKHAPPRPGDVVAGADADADMLPATLEPTLRKLGVPSRLVAGAVTLDNPYEICARGAAINATQAELLKMFGIKLADFRIRIKGYWSAKAKEVTILDG